MRDMAARKRSLSERAVATAQGILSGQPGGWSRYLAFAGPAIIASIAYMDPGNFATNIQAGARYGYRLLWVVLLANLIAMLFQALSAKLGIVTGRNLAEMCRDEFPKPVVWGMWLVSEIAAMATDLAEFLGGAVGLALLFHMPLIAGMAITAIITYGILMFQNRGFRPVELIITSFVALIALCYLVEMFIAPVNWHEAALGTVTPQIADAGALLLAVGIIGATVMPHVIYLHSALTKSRVHCADDAERRELMKFQRLDVVVALGAAGLINLAMLFVAAALFSRTSGHAVNSLEAAHAGLGHLIGGGAALAFAVALLASGLSSSSVGTYAGQVVMQGFVHRRIPLFARRALTMLPALAVLGLNLPAPASLVVSQVVLSIGIPFALVPLLLLTRRADVMGALVNRRLTTAVTAVIAAVIIGLNVYLIYVTLVG
jgi:manganese transport protein